MATDVPASPASPAPEELALLRGGWHDTWRDVREEDTAQVVRLLSQGTLSQVSGGVLARFEKRFTRFAGARHGTAFNNGTASLYAALWACGVRAGDDVLVCDYGFHGVAAAVLALGARVVPVDCQAGSLTMHPGDLAAARTPSSRAVLVHNPWGVPADFQAIRASCPDLPIVSDASHAHGATYRESGLATWADVTCFSLGVKKLITGGELGCAVTDSARLRDRMVLFGHPNRVPQDLLEAGWAGNSLGLKLRPHIVALTLAYAQVGRYEEKRASLVATCGQIEEALRPHGFIPQQVPAGSGRVWWRIVLRLDEDLFGGIPTEVVVLQGQSIFDWPDHTDRVVRRPCPTAARECPRLVTLPAPAVMSREKIDAAARLARRVSAGHDSRR
ncbi:MAG: aminotransferase class I/II-fold pyridoxal phosphate-dependent enzyme [Candidatus Riflebacteria bacterium]|nr:aminotransferase class I/II-fold pyridoxal phosphate-dependent enzyme [Candidatus Riflebacteria bacterium]